jgi:ATP-dependent Clp protease ATP-binding subunit ClpC
MFERFTDRARRVVVLAQEEARVLNHNYIGTEHILLGLLREGEGVAAKALESLGLHLEAVRQQVEQIIGKGQQVPAGHIPFTPRAKKVLELSLREALQLGHDYIGTEHILLGLLSEGEGVAAQVLVRLGADLKRVRQQVIQVLHGGQVEAAGAGPRRVTATRELWLTEIQNMLTSIADRLTAIERHLGIRPAATLGDPPTAAPGDSPTATAASDDPPAAAPGGRPAEASDDPPGAASDGT